MLPYFNLTYISIGPFKIYVWGLLVVIGFLVGLLVFLREGEKRGETSDNLLTLSIWIILGVLIGSRLLYVIGHIGDYLDKPLEIISIWHGGMTFFGGFLGALLAGWIFVKVKKLDFWRLADAMAIAIPVGYMFGRLGCFLTDLHAGKKTNLPWAVNYLDGGRHPTVLYEALFNGFILFFILYFLGRLIIKKNIRSGWLWIIFLLYFNLVRFLTDFLRSDDLPDSDIRFAGLTYGQYFSALFFIIGVWLLVRYTRQIK